MKQPCNAHAYEQEAKEEIIDGKERMKNISDRTTLESLGGFMGASVDLLNEGLDITDEISAARHVNIDYGELEIRTRIPYANKEFNYTNLDGGVSSMFGGTIEAKSSSNIKSTIKIEVDTCFTF